MKRLLYGFCLFLCITGRAQEESVFNRLHGVGIKKVLKVYYAGEGFKYSKDQDTDLTPSLLHDNIFNVSNDQKNDFHVLIRFYNPLKYNIEFSLKELEDPDLKVLSNFVSSFSDLTFPDASAPPTDAIAALSAKQKGARPDVTKAFDFVPTGLMYDWIDKFQNLFDLTKVAADIDAYNELVKIINDIKTVENFIYHKISVKGETNTVVNWVKEQQVALYAEDDFQKFNQTLARSKEVAKRLREEKEAAIDAIKNISKLLTDNFTKIGIFLKDKDSDAAKSFKAFCASKKYFLEYFTAPEIEKQGQLVDKIVALNAKLDEHVKPYNTTGFKECYAHTFAWSYDKVREYTFIAKTYDADGNTTKKDTAVFTVAKDKGLVFFASTGVFYTPYSFDNFGIEAGKAVSTKPTKVYVRPTAYLNLLFKPKRGDTFYFLAQVGVSVGNDAPMIPVGIGFLLRNSFSISAGGLLAWQNELDGLNLNDPVDDAKLKNALKKTVDVGWYVSINYKLGK